MSKRVEAKIQCPSCGLIKQMSLYRSLWVEDSANLALVMSDMLNLFECARCGLRQQLPFAVLCTNVKRSIAIWYEPEPDPAVDDDIRQYTAHFGPNHFFSRAERIADWEHFKRRLSQLLNAGQDTVRNRNIFPARPSAADGAQRPTLGPHQRHTADAVRQTTQVLPITRAQLAGLLVKWLEKNSGPDAVRQIVKETGYNDSPFFGAERQRVRVIGEVATVNTALVIFAVNQVFVLEDARVLIDTFLGGARGSVFQVIETKDPGFARRYEQRMAEYFQVLSEDKPGLGISFCFLRNLDLDPIKSMQAQVRVAARLGKALGETIDMLRRFQLDAG